MTAKFLELQAEPLGIKDVTTPTPPLIGGGSNNSTSGVVSFFCKVEKLI